MIFIELWNAPRCLENMWTSYSFHTKNFSRHFVLIFDVDVFLSNWIDYHEQNLGATFFATSEIEIPLLMRIVSEQTSIMSHFQSRVTDYSSAPECQGNFVLQLSIFCHSKVVTIIILFEITLIQKEYWQIKKNTK